MKQLKLTAATTVLTLALSFSAFAGDIYGGFAYVPPQTTTSATTSSTTATSQSAAVDPVIQLMLVLLNLLP